MNKISKKARRQKRQRRVRAKTRGTKDRPRLSIFRSNKYIYAQIINDEEGETIVHVSSKEVDGTGLDSAKAVGKRIAEEAKKKGVKKVVFDRGGFLYSGNVKALAESARKAGLDF